MENVDPLSNLVTNKVEKFGTLGPSFASISIEKLWPQVFQISEPTCRIYEHEALPYSRKYSEKAFKPIGCTQAYGTK